MAGKEWRKIKIRAHEIRMNVCEQHKVQDRNVLDKESTGNDCIKTMDETQRERKE